MEEIKTEHLILRSFIETDYDDLYEFLFQLENDEFEGYPGIDYEIGKEYLKERIGSDEYYAIELKDIQKVIGNIYCGKRDFNAREVGYIVNRNYQREGYACEALCAIIDSLFKEGIHRVYAECDPRNVGSWKLPEKAGLKREAHLRQNVYFHKDDGNPIWKDTYIYAITESDY